MLKSMSRGFSLVELLVALAIVAILVAAGAPGMSQWLQNGQIRNAAEAMQSGLQLARAEAVRRNAMVRFQLTTTAGADCAISTGGNNWVISMDDPTGACNATASETDDPRIIQLRPASEGSSKAVVASGLSTFVFNGVGRLTPVPAGNTDIDISNPAGGACQPTGPMRCLRVRVSQAGQVRLCDPSRLSTDPQGC